MFGRKKRTASNPPLKINGSTANPSATLAASQAFLGHRASNASLSAAAAAAALRSRPTTPISVADVQTKRMMRRTNSNSSMGSSVAGSQGRPSSQLERKGSSGSMSERTFRDPSPNRGPGRHSIDDAPPVPPIPQNLPTPVQSKSHRRTSSLEAPPMRIASPPPNKANGRGSSLGPTGAQGPSRPAQRTTNLSSVQELTSIESRGSVNFSYPTNGRATSPYGQMRLTSPTPQSLNQNLLKKQELVYDPNTRTFRPEAELMFYEQSIRDAADRPVKKKKAPSHGAPGSHFAEGTSGGRIRGTAVDAIEQVKSPIERVTSPAQRQQDPVERVKSPVERVKSPPVQKSEPPKLAPIITTAANTETPKRKKKVAVKSTGDTSGNESDGSERPQQTYNTRAGHLLAKKPSVVREEQEPEDSEDSASKALGRQAALNALEGASVDTRTVSPSPQQRVNPGKGHGRGGAALASAAFSQNRQQTRSASQPAPNLNANTPKEFDISDAPTGTVNGSGKLVPKGSRVQSVSPARNAHFLSTPESATNLSVRHDPPSRSISPRKSALKHSPSPHRGPSPSGDVPGAWARRHGQTMSEVSDTSTARSDEPTTQKKKSVRVSFDDESNTVLGRADTLPTTDSPIVPSPQSKKGWFSNTVRGKKSDVADVPDEVMTPRPALPSFGSVREKKYRDVEERPLVKPAEALQPLPSPPIFTTVTGETIEHPMATSADHAIGAVFAEDLISKNEANISKSREPLPPQVTSVEGSGYMSDSDSSIHSVEKPTKAPAPASVETEQKINRGHVETHADLSTSTANIETDEISSEKANGNGSIPKFAITQATPTLDGREWPTMPGGFPGNASESGSSTQDDPIAIVGHRPTEPTLATLGIAEPEPTKVPAGSPHIGSIATENSHMPEPIYEDTETETESIYSDAAEDLSDIEGDGFMSLDAVVESPVVANVQGYSMNSPPDSPTTKHLQEKAYKKSLLSRKTSEPDLDEGWEKTQKYWSGLTAEKKLELERAARDESDSSGSETEQEITPPRKTGKKVIVRSPDSDLQLRQPPSSAKDQNRMYQIPPGSKASTDAQGPTMRSSMRTASPASNDIPTMRTSLRGPQPTAPDDGRMRKTMRAGGGSMRGTSRGSTIQVVAEQPKAALQKKYRPMSLPATEVAPDPVEVQKHMRKMSAGAAAAAPAAAKKITQQAPPVRREESPDSDSSFRPRRARQSTDGFAMKRSMRDSPQQQQQTYSLRPQSPDASSSQVRSSRFSLRSLSPTGSTVKKPFASSAPTPPASMGRTSMRGNRASSRDSNTPTLRTPKPERTKSPLNLFGRSKAEPKAKSGPKRASRFADSSDEEDVQPAYRSRYADSSDEDDIPPPSFRPSAVRSVPRQALTQDGDSSDLPDSDDEKRLPPKVVPKIIKAPQIVPAATQSTALSSGSLRRSGSGRDFSNRVTTTTTVTGGATSPTTRPQQKRRGSLMSILRRKKDPPMKIQKIETESGARIDTPLERSRPQLAAVKRQDSEFSLASANSNGRLQKRTGPNPTHYETHSPLVIGNGNDNWPLAAGVASGGDGQDGRPYTSDGQASTLVNGRPELGNRRVTDAEVGTVGPDGHTLRRKKKKFGALRRAFGLDV